MICNSLSEMPVYFKDLVTTTQGKYSFSKIELYGQIYYISSPYWFILKNYNLHLVHTQEVTQKDPTTLDITTITNKFGKCSNSILEFLKAIKETTVVTLNQVQLVKPKKFIQWVIDSPNNISTEGVIINTPIFDQQITQTIRNFKSKNKGLTNITVTTKDISNYISAYFAKLNIWPIIRPYDKVDLQHPWGIAHRDFNIYVYNKLITTFKGTGATEYSVASLLVNDQNKIETITLQPTMTVYVDGKYKPQAMPLIEITKIDHPSGLAELLKQGVIQSVLRPYDTKIVTKLEAQTKIDKYKKQGYNLPATESDIPITEEGPFFTLENFDMLRRRKLILIKEEFNNEGKQ